MRIAVISDIHAAYAPFQQAVAAARRAGFDELVLLGDLFTYGINPLECAQLAHETIERDGAILIGGNHDQLYVDLQNGGSSYVNGLADWIRESVDWTWSKLGGTWPEGLDWVEELSRDALLLSHANPFGYGDWTYLADGTRLERAAEALQKRSYRWGVFGHLHRAMEYVRADGVTIHVVGAIGQPRDQLDMQPQWTMLEIGDEGMNVSRQHVEFDTAAHCAAIQAEPGLSQKTKNTLCGYFQ
jgi:Calcineurin-like phosphoesterase superfamily domain